MTYVEAPLEYTSEIPDAKNTRRNWPVVIVEALAEVIIDRITEFVRKSAVVPEKIAPPCATILPPVTADVDTPDENVGDCASDTEPVTVKTDTEALDAFMSPVSDRLESTVVPSERYPAIGLVSDERCQLRTRLQSCPKPRATRRGPPRNPERPCA